MKYFALLFLAAVLAVTTGCQPGDAKARSTKERLERGELVEFTEAGYLRPSCSGRPWADFRLNEEPERGKVIVGQIRGFMATGMKTCHQVGSSLYMTVRGKGGPELGLVHIKKIGLVKAQFARKEFLAGKFYGSAESFNKVLNDVTARLKPEDQGVVTIITLDYVKGTAVDEAKVIADEQQASEEPAGDGYSETKADGQTVSACTGSPWTDVQVVAALQAPLQGGQLKSVYRLGDKNCIPQGGEFDITLKRGDPAFMRVKAVKVKKFRWALGVSDYFVMNGFVFEELKTLIATDPYAAKSEWITVVDFAPLAGASLNSEGVVNE